MAPQQKDKPQAPPQGGYYRWPALHGSTLAFVCEDDLYSVPLEGGRPHRLTDAPGPVRRPVFSPDGSRVAFTVQEEGCQELYTVSVEGGPLTQVTFAGADFVRVASWSPDGAALFFTSSLGQPFTDMDELWYVSAAGGAPTRANLGPVYDAGFQPGGPGRVIGRNTDDPATAHWKGYKGGCTGEVWVDAAGDGAFKRLNIQVMGPTGAGGKPTGMCVGNIGSVTWATKNRVVFVADDGSGRSNLYSLNPPDAAHILHAQASTGDVSVLATRHTARTDFCVRYPTANAAVAAAAASEEGKKAAADEVAVAYCAGGRLFVSRIGDGPAVGVEVPIKWAGPRAQLERRAVDPEEYIDDWGLHPEGLTLLTVVRGQAFTMGLWDGPALAYPPVPVDAAGSASSVGLHRTLNKVDP
jgi:tricorn protease